MGLRCNECDKRPARRPSAGAWRAGGCPPLEGRVGIRLAAAPRRPVLPLASCPLSDVLALFGSPVPRPRSSGRAQQFWRMYVPSMLALRPFRLELSLLLMVLATVYKPRYPQRVHYSISSNATILTFEYCTFPLADSRMSPSRHSLARSSVERNTKSVFLACGPSTSKRIMNRCSWRSTVQRRRSTAAASGLAVPVGLELGSLPRTRPIANAMEMAPTRDRDVLVVMILVRA